METVKSQEDISNLEKNKVEGNPEITNSTISFKGINNVLYCEGNVKIINAQLLFEGNNSIVYLSSSMNSQYSFTLVIYNNSTFFIGREGNLSSPVTRQFRDCLEMLTANNSKYLLFGYLYNAFYTASKLEDVSLDTIRKSVYKVKDIIDNNISIVDNYSFVPHNAKVPSNSLVVGNPAQIEKQNVFYTKEFLGYHKAEDSVNTQEYKSDVFIYEFVNQETLNLKQIDKILKELDVNSRIEFIQKLFVRNKRKNRFTI